MTNADWGCGDGEHKAWIVVELDNKEQARTILPPLFRENAKIIQLQQFNVDASQETIQKHSD